MRSRTSGRGEGGGGCNLAWPHLTLIAFSVASLFAPPAFAGPTGGQVVAGTADIRTQGSRTDIVQRSDRAVIDWRQFSIERNEAVYFQQPSGSSVALNRVTGDQVSHIQGILGAQGQVILLNPNGILFGAGAQVNAGSFIASTSWLSSEDFMAGRLTFTAPTRRADGSCSWSRCEAGSIVNRGTISVRDQGLVALVAPHVRNDGVIWARLGKVSLGSGSTFTLDVNGDGLLGLALRAQDAADLRDVEGNRVAALIENTGTISAAGGQVFMTTPAVAREAIDNVINLAGIVRADTAATGARGSIELKAANGRINIAGELAALALEAGHIGGTVNITAPAIAFGDNAFVSAGAPGGNAGTVGLRYLGNGLTIDDATAAALGNTLRTGTHVTLYAGGSARLTSRIDGRAAEGARSGNFSIDAAAVFINNDVYTSGGDIRLNAREFDIEMAKSATLLAPNRTIPILYAGSGTIGLKAFRNVFAHHLITSGNVVIESVRGNVELRERLGRGGTGMPFEHGPIGSLRVTALGVPDAANPGEVKTIGNLAMLRDVAVRPGGEINIHVTRNIRLMEGVGISRGTPTDSRIGLTAARNGMDGRKLFMRSERLTESGDIAADAWYWEGVNSQISHLGPDRNIDRTDGRWIDRTLLARDPDTPTITPPGPTNLSSLSTTARAATPAPTDPGALNMPPPLDPPAASGTQTELTQSGSQTDVIQSGGQTDLTVVRPRNESPSLDGAELAYSGTRGVARDADLGQRRSTDATRDVFGNEVHVVQAQPCEDRLVAGNSYFQTGAFGQSLASGCQ